MSIIEALLSPRRKASYGGPVYAGGGMPAPFMLSSDPRKKAAQALHVWQTNIWVRAAERTISTKIGAAESALYNEEGERVTPDSPDAQAAVLKLLARPYIPAPGDPVTAAPQTKRALWSITSRHMGVVGYAFWYLDQTDALAGMPLQLLYIHPARMTPHTDANGGLIAWVMDYGSQNPVKFAPDTIIKFDLEPPDTGHLGIGLVESAISKMEMSRLTDKHANQVLGAGGRKVGIYAPPTGQTMNDEAFLSMQRDLRAVSDMPDSSKRSLVLKGPMGFTETSNTPGELDLPTLSDMSRDAILALWGVPRSQLGMEVPAGLGDSTKDKDVAVLWENAIVPRIRSISEQVNTQLLPRYEEATGRLAVVVDTPTFDDEVPRYDMAAKASGQPLRNVERRAILGLGPLGEPALDDAVWLPVNMVPAFDTPAHDPDTLIAKAQVVNPRLTRQMAKALDKFLEEQAARIGTKMVEKSDAVARKPNDPSPYWNDKQENALLMEVMAPFMVEESKAGYKVAKQRIGAGKADLKLAAFDDDFLAAAMKGIGNRVTQVNAATKSAIKNLTKTGITLGMSPAQLGTILRGTVPPLTGDAAAWEPVINGAERTFASELRAETIARTEMRVAQNNATLRTYESVGMTKVEAIDGDEDELCASRDGQTVSLETAEEWMATEHPNGTLDFMPVAI